MQLYFIFSKKVLIIVSNISKFQKVEKTCTPKSTYLILVFFLQTIVIYLILAAHFSVVL